MPAEGRRPALACIGGTGARSARPKAGTGLHWGTECRPKAGTGHGVPGRRPALACTGARSARPKAGTPVYPFGIVCILGVFIQARRPEKSFFVGQHLSREH